MTIRTATYGSSTRPGKWWGFFQRAAVERWEEQLRNRHRMSRASHRVHMGPMTIPDATLEAIEKVVGGRGYLLRPEDLKLYEYDGGVDKAQPDLVVFPQSTEDVAALVRIAEKRR